MQLRAYQARIVDECLFRNAVVVLPTGSGKTLIAAELIKRLAASKPTLFLVPKILLVAQQASAVRNWTGLVLGEYFGGEKMPTDFDVLVSTPKAFEVAQAKTPSLAWDKFALVIFDEVHHVLKDDPYRNLALKLRKKRDAPNILGLPYVLGMTASLSYAVGDRKVEASISKLCRELAIEHTTTATAAELEADGYFAGKRMADVRPSEKTVFGVLDAADRKPHLVVRTFWRRVSDRQATPFSLGLTDVILAMESSLPDFKSPLQTKPVRDWGVAAHRFGDDNRCEGDKFRDLEMWYESLRGLVISWEEAEDLSTTFLRMTGADKLSSNWPESVRSKAKAFIETLPETFPKFEKLKEVLREKVAVRGMSFRGIIFCEQRIMTHVLDAVVRADMALSLLEPVVIYATSTPATPSFSVSKQAARDNLDAFKHGRARLLVATAVAEEGMDIPKANVVICFDAVTNGVAMVQRRGRAREEGSDFIVMAERADRPVSLLAQAEARQHELVLAFEPSRDGSDDALLASAQASRERGAQGVLAAATDGNVLRTLNLYCKKTKADVEESHEGGTCTLTYDTVLRRVSADGDGSNKKKAKLNAAKALLGLLAAP
ncbi:P-loop containing nucleoside triphosphate hydrolase protein [Pelagophyceae sp. CCMP2097]|nr:P-loop containing nucleoside triphosphate hydrolase protein [Pelagophyceae sp. CCMP2097]